MERNKHATLYVVATPIGNLRDITLRALDTLHAVDYILAEDTRTSKKLFATYGVGTPVMSFHVHSGDAKREKIVALLKEGKQLALITDAGTPSISDPGNMLIAHIRDVLPKTSIVVIPGASALTAALSISGIKGSQFTFLGFLPHKKGRETLFAEMAESSHPIVFFESVHRIMKTLSALEKKMPQKKIHLFRELTKMYESYLSGTATTVHAYFKEHPEEVRGEFVVVVE